MAQINKLSIIFYNLFYVSHDFRVMFIKNVMSPKLHSLFIHASKTKGNDKRNKRGWDTYFVLVLFFVQVLFY